MKYRLAQ